MINGFVMLIGKECGFDLSEKRNELLKVLSCILVVVGDDVHGEISNNVANLLSVDGHLPGILSEGDINTVVDERMADVCVSRDKLVSVVLEIIAVRDALGNLVHGVGVLFESNLDNFCVVALNSSGKEVSATVEETRGTKVILNRLGNA